MSFTLSRSTQFKITTEAIAECETLTSGSRSLPPKNSADLLPQNETLVPRKWLEDFYPLGGIPAQERSTASFPSSLLSTLGRILSSSRALPLETKGFMVHVPRLGGTHNLVPKVTLCQLPGCFLFQGPLWWLENLEGNGIFKVDISEWSQYTDGLFPSVR